MCHKILIILGMLSCLSVGAATCRPVFATQNDRLNQAPLEQLAADFRRLRTVPGHFGGGKWDDDVDRWMGTKHRLMLELGTRLGRGEFSKPDVIQLLNPPDQFARKGDRSYQQIVSLPGYDAMPDAPDEFLIYNWRGRHDFLFFTCQGGKIIGSDWWYEGD